MKEYIFERPDEEEDTAKHDANYRGELIRCRECIKKDICSNYRYAQNEEGFCSWAAR